MIRFVLAVALATVSGMCLADEQYSARYSACMDNSGGVTVEMMNCIGAETQVQDSELNLAYKQLGAQLTSARKKQLVTAQRLWVQYREANCRFYADPDGGTAAGVASNDCFLSETARRAAELKTLGSGP
ncbi:MAG: lysozyme inhibitor LprI family protein [Dokdonella sp.]|uniref:lysozyme inhibitor LprI family protein n=1 Tax=Dokdonella sp. TaxID=2291710 RepID=UPI0032663084